MKNKTTLLNVITSLLLQMCNIISNFIIPKIVLSYFGSEVNGLISSLTQFLSYISLVEGGVTGVITASLYKPLVDRNSDKINAIINTANKFYKKIGFIFILYSILLAIVYPLLSNSNFSFIYIFSLTLVLSLNLLIQYMYSLTFKTLLNADKKMYIVSLTQIIILILNLILTLISVKIYPNIFIIKLINGALFLLQPLVYARYVKNNYDIKKNNLVDNELLKNRWNGFAINIAAFIHFSTDVTILTIFTNLETVSIYSVYALITSGLRTIINSICSGITPTLGHVYARGNQNELKQKFESFEFLNFILVYALFIIAGLLIVPFVMIYTSGINDANYYQPIFGILILFSEAIYLLKIPHLNLAYSTNKFKEITIPAFIEALLNIIISIIFVTKLGLIGIVIGTIVGMLYRLLFQVLFVKKIIKNYDIKGFFIKFLFFDILSCISIFLCIKFISTIKYNIFDWTLHLIIYLFIICFVFSSGLLLFYKNKVLYILKYVLKKK